MQLQENHIKTDGIFITSGHKRSIDLFHGQIELYERNYVNKTNFRVFVVIDTYEYIFH